MKHYVLLKFKPDYYNEEILNYTKDVFNKIRNIENIEDVYVHSNCIERDSNMDIMIEMNVKNKDALIHYINHELHRDFAKTVNEILVSKVSFDCY